jgi:hypothetical protein
VATPDNQYSIETTYNSNIIKGNWGVYYGCDENLDKPVIVIEGFDPLDSKNLGDGEAKNNLYAITDTKQHLLNNLRNVGYDIVILDFDKNNIDLRASGKLAAELIKEVNQQKQGDNELVVMGRSGGGLLARYALAYLEENNINHQTRLLLTIDAPNQGANIPLGFQHFIKFTVNSTVIMGVIGVLGNYLVNDMLDKTLNSTYSKQMLYYHHSETDKSNKKAYPSNDRTNFVNDLNSQNGGYPENLLKVAISDGSRTAQNQGFGYEANLLRWDFNLLPACNTTRLTNQVNALPDKGQTGEIIKSKIEVRFPIVPCLVYTGWVETLGLEIEINNANPYDNSPGGNAGWHRLNVNSFMPDWSNNLLTYLTGVSVEDDFECFVPVVSALDLNSNILPSEHGGLFYNVDANLASNANISRVGNFFYNLSPPTVSPFDVMYASSSNQEHAESNSEWTSLFEGEIYPSNLYLQNQEITKDRVYYARNNIIAGNNVTSDLPQGDFVIKSGAKVKMTSGGSITLSPGFSAELGSEFIATTHTETDCDIANKSLKSAKIISNNQEQSELKTTIQNPLVEIITSTEKSISVYPNPANTTLIISFNKYSDDKTNIKILDNSGKQVSSIKNANRISEINVSSFQPGIYMVCISHGKEIFTEKFIKQ